MKIGVNARLLVKTFTGIAQYTQNLFKELAKIDSENEYILVVPEKIQQEIREKFPKNVTVKVLPEKKWPTAGMRKTWWEQIQIPEFFKKEHVDVAFFTYPSNPWTKDWYKKGIKTVVTVHDCIPWMNKNYRKGILSKLYHSQTRKAVGLANLVFTVSENSKSDIVKCCKVDSDKVKVVYNDADDEYKLIRNGEFCQKILERFNLKKNKFFLYVGGYDERKNVSFLVEEFLKFVAKNYDIRLVLAGEKLFKNKLYKSFDRIEDDEKIIKTGFLKNEELACLYGNCLAFVNLSQAEGFNLPILEAANCGAPLILSDIAVHKEVAGDAAMFVELKKSFATAMMRRCLNNEVRERFSRKSKDLAQNFSWKKSAQTVKDMLNSLQ